MCWCWPFGSNTPKRNKPQVREKKKKDGYDSLHGEGVAVVAESHEKRKPKAHSEKRRSREHVSSKESPRRQRREYTVYDYRPREEYRTAEPQRPALNVQVPNMWHRQVDPASSNSSTEMLLNPRPHRSPHQRQRHPKRTSQTTLRGRGAKRDPPSRSKSKKSLKSPPKSGWSFFAPPPPKTPQKRSRDHQYQQLNDTSPRSDRSRRHHHRSSDHGTTSQPQAQTYTYAQPQTQPQPYHSQQRHHRSRQHQSSHTRTSRSRTPNTAARRTPDRRFAVLAATNQALEELRQEAFAYPSPPPRPSRRERTQRVDGYAIPTSSIPFNWDCVSSSQTSASVYAGASGSGRRRSRR